MNKCKTIIKWNALFFCLSLYIFYSDVVSLLRQLGVRPARVSIVFGSNRVCNMGNFRYKFYDFLVVAVPCSARGCFGIVAVQCCEGSDFYESVNFCDGFYSLCPNVFCASDS